MAFAVAALDLVRPPRTRVALCAGTSRVRVESGRAWGRGEGARWAMLSIPARASRRAIALAVAELSRGTAAPWALDVLLGGDRPVSRMTNYITRDGAKKLQEELARLRSSDRPKVVQDVADAAAQGDRSENAEYIYGKRKLREIDRRIHFLTKRLELVEVVEPRKAGETRVFFGATVDIEDEDGKRATYRIVGEDEIDLSRGRRELAIAASAACS